MNKENIEKQLRSWFTEMTKKYSWLRIKFEFNKVEGVYMVSFSPVSKIELSDEFNKDAMQFADMMNDEYGTEAPLFTDEESLFKLSDSAEIISSNQITTVATSATYVTIVTWASPITPEVNAKSMSNFQLKSSASQKYYAKGA